ncbi:hypothetical protein A0H81_12734 [Grifola frondosa]|uniref:Uncharacterized protein n=1 Tax=Grifola frondosa TaxID=5627 RepID=A0A1C7LRQ0_GRIFR|nr:hypothetical protein A0H81_12734 [Grifola frondosa]
MPALQNVEMAFMKWPPESSFDIEDLSSMRLSLRKLDNAGYHALWSRKDSTDELSLRETLWICWILERSHSTLEAITRSNRTLLLSGTDLLRILDIRSFVALERLEIMYQVDSNDPRMIESVVGMFPQLRVLEIHRYPSHDNERAPMNEIVTMLSRLKELHVLRLNLPSPYHPLRHVKTGRHRVFEKQAQIVADVFRLSQLCEIAFLHENSWATFYIDRHPRGSMTNLFYDKSSHRREFLYVASPTPRSSRPNPTISAVRK